MSFNAYFSHIHVYPQRFFMVVIATLHIAIAVKPLNYIEKPKVPDKVSVYFIDLCVHLEIHKYINAYCLLLMNGK